MILDTTGFSWADWTIIGLGVFIYAAYLWSKGRIPMEQGIMNKGLKDKITGTIEVLDTMSAVKGVAYTAMLHTYVQALVFEHVLQKANPPPELVTTHRLILRNHLDSVILMVQELKGLPPTQAVDEAAVDIETILKAISLQA